MAETEIWKHVLGYEGFYIISDLGNIKRVNNRLKGDRFLIQRNSKYGYLVAHLSAHAKGKTYSVHRLVLEAFIGKSELPADHKNTKKHDNRLCNLEYVTILENNIRKVQHKGSKTGIIGITYRIKAKTFTVRTTEDGKRKHIGEYKTIEEAKTALLNKTNKLIYGNIRH